MKRIQRLWLEGPDGKIRRWSVRWADWALARYSSEDGMETLGGLTLFDDRRIYINPGLTEARAVEVLIHEVLHATYPDLEESAVQRGEANIADALCSAGITFAVTEPANNPRHPRVACWKDDVDE